NSLAILIFMAQLPELFDVPFAVYPLFVLGLLILIFFPKLTKAVPAPLVSIVVIQLLLPSLPLMHQPLAIRVNCRAVCRRSLSRMCRGIWIPCPSSRHMPWRWRWWDSWNH